MLPTSQAMICTVLAMAVKLLIAYQGHQSDFLKGHDYSHVGQDLDQVTVNTEIT